MPRLIVYVDGFNYYYGAVKGTPYKWADLGKLSKILFPRDEIVLIRYFTAPVQDNPLNPGQHVRQRTYFRALRTIPNLEIHEGFFLSHSVWMPKAPPERGRVKVLKFEEKGSDVNLATHLIFDAFEDRFDVAAVISNDSDLALPIQMVQEKLGKPVGVVGYDCRLQKKYGKKCRQSARLREAASFFKTIRESALRRAQFPEELEDEKGRFRKPGFW